MKPSGFHVRDAALIDIEVGGDARLKLALHQTGVDNYRFLEGQTAARDSENLHFGPRVKAPEKT